MRALHLFAAALLLTPRVAFTHVAEPWRVAPELVPPSRSPVQAAGIPAWAAAQASAASTATPNAERTGSAPLQTWPQVTLSTVVSPVFHDLDGDGVKEVIAADDDFLRVYDVNGVVLAGWPVDIGGANEHAAVADIDRDGIPEILIGSTLPNPKIRAFTPNGVPKFGWPVDLPYQTLANTSCPVVADVIPGGDLEVVIASERGVTLLNSVGQVPNGWPYLWAVSVNNPQWSAPAVCDLDADGSVEVVVGNVNFPDWGVHVIRDDGTPMEGWPKVIRPVWSSPAVADLDQDGDLEIIVQEGDPGSQGNRMWVWHDDGTTMAGWPVVIAADGQSSRCSPAVADLDDDGVLEIVTLTGDGLLHIFTPQGIDLAGWATGGVQPISSPAVIDVDGDDVEEIFLTYWLANQQFVAGFHPDGSPVGGFPIIIFNSTDLNSHASVHVADADADGDLELAVAGSSMSQGRVWVLGVDSSIYGPDTHEDWPKIRRDAENTGCFPSSMTAAVTSPASAPKAGVLGVAPNPALSGGRVALWTPGGAAGRLRVRDASGRTLAVRSLGGGMTPELVSLRGLAGGGESLASAVYFLSFEPEHGGRSAAKARLVVRR